ncbi:hypothetical protein [Streptomyces sp. NRRL S-455]|uniref:hypothetical protein n=1 Tax=Streptomyces sp. NRRL S-455 TaxID=1463908 RepID=UPI00131A4964|nr:hypothetical protein [Streptomyces sp. NRRL S-455]
MSNRPQTDEPPFGSPGCTCKPWTREGGRPRYLDPRETVDKVSGWEVNPDCFHHAS